MLFSICIPRIENNISKRYIQISFEKVGVINKIDIISCNNGTKKAFVHFNHCYDTEIGNKFKEIIENGETVKYVHSRGGWFWKCCKSRSRKKSQ